MFMVFYGLAIVSLEPFTIFLGLVQQTRQASA